MNNYDLCKRNFIDNTLKETFGKKNFLKRYSLIGDGTYYLLYYQNNIYEFRFKQVKKIPENDGKKAYRDTLKDEIIEKIAEKLNNYSITGGKFLTFKLNDNIIQIEIVKKKKEPEGLGKVRIEGEWI